MTILQYIRNRVSALVLKKKYYEQHYKMWDFIAAHIMQDSSKSLKDPHYIDDLKSSFIHNAVFQGDVYLFSDCYLCALYYGVLCKNGCRKCPLYNAQRCFCASTESLYFAVRNDLLTRKERAEYAGRIRDCVLFLGRK